MSSSATPFISIPPLLPFNPRFIVKIKHTLIHTRLSNMSSFRASFHVRFWTPKKAQSDPTSFADCSVLDFNLNPSFERWKLKA
ncbi:hypothetical protein QVD17_20875 [Tagetes erecta]|uniref:Uncharacterized protein n=1 Tax=Tagetes erecta TaxID=13708 RepID=A0AAD8NYD1_TARER|nr:hypothetical protein QVD17_20875 [Tagetes erecta]